MRYLALVPILALAACGQQPPAAGGGYPPPPAVGVATPLAQDLAVERVLTGRLESTAVVELRPRVGGTVIKVLIADGAIVTVGQPILEIDPIPLKATLARTEADVARAQAQLDQARLAWTRAQDLKGRDAVAQSAYDDAKSNVAIAEANLAAAAAARTSAATDLDHASVTAPIAGRLGKVLATVGNVVQASGVAPGTVLGTIVATDSLDAVFDLDETTWNRLAPRLRSGKVPVRFGVAGEDSLPRKALVTFADNQVDTATGSIRLRARIANTEGDLTPGAFVRIALETEAPRPVLLVHEKAILSQLALRYVLTVDEKGITAFHPIQLGASHGALREVAGLAPTDRVAVTNLARIFFPGMPVAPVPADMATATATPAAAPAAAAVEAPAGKAAK